MGKDNQGKHGVKDETATENRASKNNCPVMVVGIGASAGGLKSLKELFSRMPAGHGVAFVLIQHLDPRQKNLTVKLLKDQTALAVVEATDGMEVLPDRIHIIPPDKFLNITGSILTLQEPVYCNGLRMPIDHFFCSLAADQGRRGCGILLSGTGSDGTIGLSEIRAAAGKTFVEDSRSAEFPGMVQSAIKAGVVDAVLLPEAMADAIIALAKEVIVETRNEPAESPEFDADLRAILEILRAKVGYDFRCYKPNTLVRRIRRRMTLAKTGTFGDYARHLGEHSDEVGFLQKDLLIGVTAFFRQPEAWEILEKKVVSSLVENAEPGSEIRVWVPGCSTGKEAYSLAMLLTERMEETGKKVGIQIFATDSDVAALATARSGSYSDEEIGGSVSAERLKKFFAPKEGRYRVIKEVRERVVFAPQNLMADPPFSRLDLISCRNLLIYLDQEMQKKIIALFHFALREGGFLFLGNAETIGDRQDLFEPVSKKWRIYRRIGVGRPVVVEIPIRPTGEVAPLGLGQLSRAAGELPFAAAPSRMSLTSTAQQMLLDRFTPACVIIDRKLQVLYVHGKVEDYLTFPAGELTTRVVDMAREGLRARLRGAIGKCIEINRSVSITARVRRGSTRFATGGEKSVPVKVIVSPLRFLKETDGLLLTTFEDVRVPAPRSRRRGAKESDVQQLEDELKVTREELQSTIEQLESSNDQLKASNEEVMAANEELQSANEEMETSKEELQSLNEELNTINFRLQEKVGELEDTNNDVVNLLSSTSIATVFLDKELKVKRFTPASTRLFSLIPSDVGRPIVDVLRRFRDGALLEDAARVLADLTPLSKEVQSEDERWYIRRITPYRTQDDRIEGVVVTFVDIADLKETEKALREAHERAAWLARFPEENLNPVLRVSAEGEVLYRNPVAAKLTGWAFEVGQELPDLLLPLVKQAVEGGQQIQQDVELGKRIYFVAAMPFPAERYANIYAHDITERKKAEEALRISEERAREQAGRLQATMDAAPALIWIARDREGKEITGNRAAAEFSRVPIGTDMSKTGAAPERLAHYRIFKNGVELTPREMPIQRVAATGKELREYPLEFVFDDGTVRSLVGNVTPLFDPQGQPAGAIAAFVDITERKRAEKSLSDSEERFKLLSETAGRLLETDEPQRIVSELCRNVMTHLDCQAFFNFLVDDEVGRLHLNTYAGIPEEEARKIEWLDFGVAVCGCAARDGMPIIAENICTTPDPRTELVKSYGIQAYACHPLMVQGRLIGTLSFGTKTRPQFFLEELALMRTVTDQVATAMERMRLVQELQLTREKLEIRVRQRTAKLAKVNEALRDLSSRLLSAQEEERKRIAGEIHDTIGASLSAIKFKVENALQQIGKNPETESLNSLIPVVQESIEECRRIQMDLRPSMLDDLGLLPTLSWFFRTYQTIYSGIRIEPEIDIREDEVPRALKIIVYRVTQEAMNNIAKHSHADLVRLSLRKREGRIELALQDNGRGFNLEKALSHETMKKGLGLSSMRERTELSGGSFDIDSTEGKGTTVRASWPVA